MKLKDLVWGDGDATTAGDEVQCALINPMGVPPAVLSQASGNPHVMTRERVTERTRAPRQEFLGP